MISVSDNTATDHLIDLVGRDRVEQALTDLGHSDPAATIPMPTTRELFVIKTNPDLLARYEAAGVDERRALLAGEVAAAPLPSVADFPTNPTAVTTVEWFASPADLCRALVALDDLATRPGPRTVGRGAVRQPRHPARRRRLRAGAVQGRLGAGRPVRSLAGGAPRRLTDRRRRRRRRRDGARHPPSLQLLALGLTLP